jgi:hypothetical protein
MILSKNDIHQILTKYFYKENQLCYQILVQTKQQQTYIAGSFSSYSEYRRALASTEEKIESGTVIDVMEYPDENLLLSAVA